MRTTLTLEPDVAARLDEYQMADLDISFKELVNGLLRMALAQRDAAVKRHKNRRFSTRVFHGSTALADSITSTHGMLALAEGEDYR